MNVDFPKNPWQGSAGKLLGNNSILVVFACYGENYWSDEDKAVAQEKIQAGIDFLHTEAERYGASFDMSVAYLQEQDAYGSDISFKRQSDISGKKLAQALGYEDLVDMFLAYHEAETSMIVVVAVNTQREGRAYASAEYSEKLEADKMCHRMEFAEFCVLFREKQEGDFQINPFTVAHELLHLYSLPDLYNEGAENDEEIGRIDAKIAERIGNDIMRVVWDSPEISPYSAYLAGWIDTFEDWFWEVTVPAQREHLENVQIFHAHIDSVGNFVYESEEVLPSVISYLEGRGTITQKRLNGHDAFIVWHLEEYDEQGELAYDECLVEVDEGDEYLTLYNASYNFKIPRENGAGWILQGKAYETWHDCMW